MKLHVFLHRGLTLPFAFLLAFCLLLVGLALPNVPALAAQGPGTLTVRGQVVNGTEGGDVPSLLPVTLHAVDQVQGRVATYNGTTDERGSFLFQEVEPLGGGSYVLVTDYAGMRYSELLESDDLPGPAELKVYEVTRDISVIQVNRQAMIIADVDPAEREITALEVLSVANTSDRTLLPELTNITNPADINFLRFSLPADATDLSVQSTLPGGDIIPMGTGFAVTAPVLPGEHEITYTYRFSYLEDSAVFNQRLIQGAQRYQVLAPVSLSRMQVAPLEAKPRIDVSGTSYLVWEASEVPPGRGISLQFSRLPQPSLTSRLVRQVKGADLWLTAIPVALAAALAALLVWAWFRAPGAGVGANATYAAGLSRGDFRCLTRREQSRRQSLIQAIALLDDRFEQGQIEEAEYRPRRHELMGQLRQQTSPLEREAGS